MNFFYDVEFQVHPREQFQNAYTGTSLCSAFEVVKKLRKNRPTMYKILVFQRTFRKQVYKYVSSS